MALLGLSGIEFVRWTPVLVLTWLITLTVYRRYFHPLAKFPGPMLASVTYLYEYYYDIWLEGQSTFKLKDLHEKYGRLRFAMVLGS